MDSAESGRGILEPSSPDAIASCVLKGRHPFPKDAEAPVIQLPGAFPQWVDAALRTALLPSGCLWNNPGAYAPSWRLPRMIRDFFLGK